MRLDHARRFLASGYIYRRFAEVVANVDVKPVVMDVEDALVDSFATFPLKIMVTMLCVQVVPALAQAATKTSSAKHGIVFNSGSITVCIGEISVDPG